MLAIKPIDPARYDLSNKSLRKFECLYANVLRGYNGCYYFIYEASDLLEYLELGDADYFKAGEVLMRFAASENLSFYAAPKDSYDLDAASRKCIAEHTCGVIVESLS